MRRRTYRSASMVPPRRKAVAVALAAPALPSARVLLLAAVAVLLALLLPALASAAPVRLAAEPALQVGDGVALLQVQTSDETQVLVEWGLAPNAGKAVRSSAGTSHQLVLQGLEPGSVYVYRVLVGGRVVVPPTPFRTEGAAPAPQLPRA